MKRLIVIAFVAISVLAAAHEFWLQPKKFRYNVGEDVKIDFLVGENFTGEAWQQLSPRREITSVTNWLTKERTCFR